MPEPMPSVTGGGARRGGGLVATVLACGRMAAFIEPDLHGRGPAARRECSDEDADCDDEKVVKAAS